MTKIKRTWRCEKCKAITLVFSGRVMYARSIWIQTPLFWSALVTCALILALHAPEVVMADDCARLNREVVLLRAEYKEAARIASSSASNVGFDELVVVLDKIVEAKKRMRSLGCGEGKKPQKKNF